MYFRENDENNILQGSVRSDLSAQEVIGVAFSIEKKGYSVDEVDFLLESVAATIIDLNLEIVSLREKLENLHE